jgi:hypothetical protein
VNEHSERTYSLLEESLSLQDGEERIALCEEALAEADLSGDLETQYDAQAQCVRAWFFGGAPEKALVGFTWLLAQFDNNPGKFSEWDILWKYKWMFTLICDFPQISRDRIQQMLDDFEARATRAGYGLYTVYNQRYRVEKFWDNETLARQYYDKMTEFPIDNLSDCAACLRDEIVEYSIYTGALERAVQTAQPLVNGQYACTTVPHRTYAKLLLPMVQLGRQEEALDYHRAGYRLIGNNRRFLYLVSDHLIFLTLTENFEKATDLFDKYYRWTEQNRNSADLFHFYRAAWLMFDVIHQREEFSRLGALTSFGIYHDLDYLAGSLSASFKRKAEDLAQQFDARNETDFFSRTLRETPMLKKLCTPFPLE